jgi:integrase
MKELDELYAALPEWLRVSIYLCGVMTLREGEYLALQRKDVELDRTPAILHVRQSAKEIMKDHQRIVTIGTTKTPSSVRDIPLPNFLVKPLSIHLDRFVDDKPDAYLFTSHRSGKLVKQQTVRNAFYHALKKTSITNHMRFYDLRHTAITHLRKAIVSTNTIRRWSATHQIHELPRTTNTQPSKAHYKPPHSSKHSTQEA